MVDKEAVLISVFLEIITIIREEILEKFQLPIGISYWNFLVLLGFVGIVINALINRVPADISANAIRERKKSNSKSDKKEG